MPKCFYLGCDEDVEYFHCDAHFDSFMAKAMGKCFVVGCSRDAKSAKGECDLHYRRMRNHKSYGDPSREVYSILSPSVNDIYWAAGFLEGDGWFGLKKNGYEDYERVVASQVQKEPLEKLKAMFGGRLNFCKTKKSTYNDVWTWNVNGIRARGVMLTLFSLLSTKRKSQIKLSLVTRPMRKARVR